jgi:anthranilate phosphoribosyltransferase
MKRAPLAALKVDDPEASAKTIREIFAGTKGACRDIVLLNAGAALVVAGKAEDLTEGIERAAQAIDSQAAAETFAQLVRLSQGS